MSPVTPSNDCKVSTLLEILASAAMFWPNWAMCIEVSTLLEILVGNSEAS